MNNQEYQLQKLRIILLDETKLNAERVAAQKQIMKILDLKEKDSNGKYEKKIKITNIKLYRR